MLPLPVQQPAPESNSSLLYSSVKRRTFSSWTSSEKTKRETRQKLSSSSFTYQSLAKSLQMEKPLTNDQICNLIADRLAELRSTLSSRTSLNNGDRDAPRESQHHPRDLLDWVKISRRISGSTPTPKDEGDPRLTEHPGIKKEGGCSEVFTPSGEATQTLETRGRIPDDLGVMVQKKRGDSNLKPAHVTGLERKSPEEEHNAGKRSILKSFPSAALTDDAGSAVTAAKMMEKVPAIVAASKNKHKRLPAGETLPVTVLRDPQYDDIIDEDLPGKTMTNDEDKFADKNLCCENAAVDSESSPPEPSINRYDHGPVQANRKSDEQLSVKEAQTRGGESCLYPCSVGAGDGLQRRRDSGWPTNRSYSPCTALDGQPDDEGDGWEVIPVSIINLTFEPKGDGEYGDKVPKPVSASAFAQMEVFDTPVEQEQTVKLGQLSFVVPSLCSSPKQKRKESCSEDSYETEDSCDYSSGPEGNYLTVSRQLLKNLPTSALPKTPGFSDSKSGKEKNEKERKRLLRGQSRRRQQALVIDLDSGDESDKNCSKRKKRRSSPSSENRGRGNLSPRTDQHGQIHLRDENIITILSDSDE